MDDGATATAGSILERKSMARLVHEVFFPTLAIGLCLLLIACDEGPSRPAPPPPFSHPPGPPAVAGVPVETHQSTVRLFLDHLARRESEAGWDLLSRESRALYPDIMAFARQTSELAELAADLLADPALTWTTGPWRREPRSG